MPKKDRTTLITEAQTIRDEASPEANTAIRVGSMNEDIVDSMIHQDDPPALLASQPYYDFTGVVASHEEGRLYYDGVKKNHVAYNDVVDVALDLGLELWVRVYNDTGVQIDNLKICQIAGVDTGVPKVDLAQADAAATSDVIGWATHDIADQTTGYIVIFGTLDGDTTGLTLGQQLYLSPTSAGDATHTRPLPPDIIVPVGLPLLMGASGRILARVQDIIRPEEITTAGNFNSAVGITGVNNYIKGYYTFEPGFTPSGTPNTFGTLNVMYGAHVYIVLGAASTDMVVRVTGDSWDEGTEVLGDTEDIDTSGGSTNDYFQTSKKFNGIQSLTLLSGTGVICNTGFAHYWDNNNRRFILTQVLWTGVAGAADAGVELEVIKHSPTGWTYNVVEAVPPTPVIQLSSSLTNNALASGQPFSFKLGGFSDVITGDNEEGIVTRIVYNSNNSISYSDIEFKLFQ